MFELHYFFELLEPAWQADPNKTARVLGGLIAHAKKKGLDTTVSILEHSFLQLADGHGLSVVGGYSPNGIVATLPEPVLEPVPKRRRR